MCHWVAAHWHCRMLYSGEPYVDEERRRSTGSVSAKNVRRNEVKDDGKQDKGRECDKKIWRGYSA